MILILFFIVVGVVFGQDVEMLDVFDYNPSHHLNLFHDEANIDTQTFSNVNHFYDCLNICYSSNVCIMGKYNTNLKDCLIVTNYENGFGKDLVTITDPNVLVFYYVGLNGVIRAKTSVSGTINAPDSYICLTDCNVDYKNFISNFNSQTTYAVYTVMNNLVFGFLGQYNEVKFTYNDDVDTLWIVNTKNLIRIGSGNASITEDGEFQGLRIKYSTMNYGFYNEMISTTNSACGTLDLNPCLSICKNQPSCKQFALTTVQQLCHCVLYDTVDITRETSTLQLSSKTFVYINRISDGYQYDVSLNNLCITDVYQESKYIINITLSNINYDFDQCWFECERRSKFYYNQSCEAISIDNNHRCIIYSSCSNYMDMFELPNPPQSPILTFSNRQKWITPTPTQSPTTRYEIFAYGEKCSTSFASVNSVTLEGCYDACVVNYGCRYFSWADSSSDCFMSTEGSCDQIVDVAYTIYQHNTGQPTVSPTLSPSVSPTLSMRVNLTERLMYNTNETAPGNNPYLELTIDPVPFHLRKLVIAIFVDRSMCERYNNDHALIRADLESLIGKINGLYTRELGIYFVLHQDIETMFCTPQNGCTQSSQRNAMTFLPFLKTIMIRQGMLTPSTQYDVLHGISSEFNGGFAYIPSFCVESFGGVSGTTTGNLTYEGFVYNIFGHELGHQMGAEHAFRDCFSGGASLSEDGASESGSGLSVMSYSGVCDKGKNLNSNVQPFFSAVSIEKIQENFKDVSMTCGIEKTFKNNFPRVAHVPETCIVPLGGKFGLDAIVLDATYFSWEQSNTGYIDSRRTSDVADFRPYHPVNVTTRWFPNIYNALYGDTQWEYTPQYIPQEIEVFLTSREFWGNYAPVDPNDPLSEVGAAVVNKTYVDFVDTKEPLQWISIYNNETDPEGGFLPAQPNSLCNFTWFPGVGLGNRVIIAIGFTDTPYVITGEEHLFNVTWLEIANVPNDGFTQVQLGDYGYDFKFASFVIRTIDDPYCFHYETTWARTIPPTSQPTFAPSFSPTSRPSISPTLRPTLSPLSSGETHQPSTSPTQTPSISPSFHPSTNPTISPTMRPSRHPSTSPTMFPTFNPTRYPTFSPTTPPTKAPSTTPTVSPSVSPSGSPSKNPTGSPTKNPTGSPTLKPSRSPTVYLETFSPTVSPTTSEPTISPTGNPTTSPTRNPSRSPSSSPSNSPSVSPTISPTGSPTFPPIDLNPPTEQPSFSPTKFPTASPSKTPSKAPTSSPTTQAPTTSPTSLGNSPGDTTTTSASSNTGAIVGGVAGSAVVLSGGVYVYLKFMKSTTSSKYNIIEEF